MATELLDLSAEIYLEIFKYMDVRTVRRMARVSRFFYQFVDEYSKYLPKAQLSVKIECREPPIKAICNSCGPYTFRKLKGTWMFSNFDTLINSLRHFQLVSLKIDDLDSKFFEKISYLDLEKMTKLHLREMKPDLDFVALKRVFDKAPLISVFSFHKFSLTGSSLMQLLKGIEHPRWINLTHGEGLAVDDEILKMIGKRSTKEHPISRLCIASGTVSQEALFHFMETAHIHNLCFLYFPCVSGNEFKIVKKLKLENHQNQLFDLHLNMLNYGLPAHHNRNEDSRILLYIRKVTHQ